MFDLQRLRALHAVHQHGSVAAAAAALGFTSSAVSQQINKLERDVRSPLLEKAGRGVILTDAGVVLAKAAENILATTEEAHAELEELRSGISGTLRVLCFPTAIRGLVAPALAELRHTAPDLTIQIEESWMRAPERVEGGHADVAITHDWVDSPLELPEQLVATHLLEDPVDIIMSSQHPLADRKSLVIDDLLDEPWITDVPGESICSQWLRRQAASRGKTLNIAHRVDEYPSQLALISTGLAISTMPRLGRPALPDSVRAVSLRGDKPVRRISSICRKSSSRRPAIRTLNAALERQV